MTSALGMKRQSNIVEKLASSKLFWFLFIAFSFSVPIIKSVNRELPKDLPVLKKLPEFKLLNSFGKPFGSKELKGRVYIANFIFTSCPSTCLRLTKEMEKVQKRVRGLGQKVALVSFSVDPEYDTPKVLYKYAREKRANPYIWTFLTGEKKQMRNLLIDGFSVPMGEKEEVQGVVGDKKVSMLDIAHTEKFALVDQDGSIRGYYDSTKDDINHMMIDVGLLVNRKEYFKK